jgi:hypothetical protein
MEMIHEGRAGELSRDAEPEMLKGVWRIQAGAVPGKGVDEYDKLFVYTEADEEKDRLNACNPAYQTILSGRKLQAMAYLFHISDPRLSRWAELTFQWF